jgi:uncharacterized protein with HEPN domain
MNAADPDAVLLQDMLCSAALASEFVAQTDLRSFGADRLTVSAVEWQLCNVGRAAGRVSVTTRARIPELEWNELAAFADRLLREYRDVTVEEVWTAATVSVPGVISRIEPLMAHADLNREQTSSDDA